MRSALKATSTRIGRPTPPSTRRAGRGCRVKREDVEALRARVLREAENAAGRGVKLADMTFSVEGDTLDALCRAWLALDGAPSVEVTECNQLAGTPDFDYGDMLAAVAGLPIGTTVRIVPTTNTTTPPDPGHEREGGNVG